MSQKLRDAAIAVSFMVAAMAFAYAQVSGVGRGPRSIDAAALGSEFVPKLAASLADGFDAGADTLEGSDGTVAAAIEKQKVVFADARAAAFEKAVGPAFALIVPDGKEPESRGSRIELARAWRDFAKGLRRAK